MTLGTLTLDRFNGLEQFSIVKATIFDWEKDGNIYLNFDIETGDKPLKSLPDTEEFHAQPNAEFTILFKELDWNKLVGCRFKIPSSYNEEIEDYVTRLYYYEHDDVEDNLIEIIKQDGEKYFVKISGTCTDVNFYDGSKPDTKVLIEAWFEKNKNF